MTINRDGYRNYDACVVITDFPPQKSPEEAALKLADWLKRLGGSIETNFKNTEASDS